MPTTPEAAVNLSLAGSHPGLPSPQGSRPPVPTRCTAVARRLRAVPSSSESAAARHAERGAEAVKLLSLVKRVAFEMREHLPAHLEIDDLAGAGVLGLLDAVQKFDARKHVKIETYARHRIRGAILDSLRSLDTASRDMRRKNKAAERVYHELQAKTGRPVTDNEMARALGISLKKWYRTVHELQSMGIDWLRPTQMPEDTAVDVKDLPAHDAENQVDLCYRREQKDLLVRALTQLSERERTVVALYYKQEMTMKEIGDQLGIDESRVSQLHSAAISHLRSRVQSMMRPPRPSVGRSHLEGETQSQLAGLYL